MGWLFGNKRDEHVKAIKALEAALKQASSYQEWLQAAEELDRLLGNEEWKNDPESDLYDSELVQYRTDQLRQAIGAGDYDALLFLIRTTLQRNLGNMGDPRLYTHSKTGTKKLIEEYHDTCLEAIKLVTEADKGDKTKTMNTVIQARRAFGRTALLLSGGSTFGTLHIGVIKELFHNNLLPRVISGSSAGSIFASILGIHTDQELDDVLSMVYTSRFDIFEESGSEEGLLERVSRFLKQGTWYDIKYLANTMRELLGDLTFQEAYYRTGRILNVAVSAAGIYEMPRLLNYLTAPHVLVWSAVCASCSLPLVFASYEILYKDPRTGEHKSWTPASFIDGSVYSDMPLTRLSEMFNVNHFIACQVNPHIAPMVQFLENFNSIPQAGQLQLLTAKYPHMGGNIQLFENMFSQAQSFAKSELSHIFEMLAELGIFSNASSKAQSMIDQDYSGDITILPETKWSEAGQLFKNPTTNFLLETQHRGAKATWPLISLIRNHCTIELALDKAVHSMRSAIISKSLGVRPYPTHTMTSASGFKPNKSMLAIRDTQWSFPSNGISNSDKIGNHNRRKSDSIRLIGRKKSWTDNRHIGKGRLSPSTSRVRLHNSHSSHSLSMHLN